MTLKPIRPHQDIIFGVDGNEPGFLGQGWADPEPGRRWTNGGAAQIRLIHPGNMPLILLFDAAPHILAPDEPRQRVELEANGVAAGGFVVTDSRRHAVAIPPDLVPAGDLLHLRIGLPDAARLSEAGLAPHALCLKRLRLFTAARVLPRRLPGSDGLSRAGSSAATGLAMAETLAQFEDIYGNVTASLQAAVGVEAAHWLAGASLGLPALLAALESGFAGLGDPGNFDIRVSPFDPASYTVLDRDLGAEFPGRFAASGATLSSLIEQEAIRLKRLRHGLTTLLGGGRKILVASGPDLTEADALPLLLALNRIGTNMLLFLEPAKDGDPPGTVEQKLPCLLRGACPPGPPSAANMPAWLDLFANVLALSQGNGRVLPAPAEATAQLIRPASDPVAPARPRDLAPKSAIAPDYAEVQSLVFGIGGNEETSIGFGWSAEEDGFRWTDGAESELWLEHPGARDAVISIAAWPYLDPPIITGQRLVLVADKVELGSFSFAEAGWRGAHVPAAALPASKVLRLICRLPDSARPSEVSGGGDNRRLGLAFMRLEIAGFAPAAPSIVHGQSGLRPDQVAARTGLQPDELVARFETLGGSNVFAEIQSRAGAEPQGLLRYAGMHLRALIDALHQRLAGIGVTEQMEHSVVSGDRPVYAVTDRASTLSYVTAQTIDEVDPETLVVQHARRIRFLRDHLLEDVEAGARIFVYHRPANEPPLTEALMLPLAMALRKIGPAVLLYVTEHDRSEPPGTVRMQVPGLMQGYLGAAADEAARLAQWLEICANAVALQLR